MIIHRDVHHRLLLISQFCYDLTHNFCQKEDIYENLWWMLLDPIILYVVSCRRDRYPCLRLHEDSVENQIQYCSILVSNDQMYRSILWLYHFVHVRDTGLFIVNGHISWKTTYVQSSYFLISCRWMHWIWWQKLHSKGFDPRISSVDFQCTNHYSMEPSVILNIFKWTLFYIIAFVAFAEFSGFIDSAI